MPSKPNTAPFGSWESPITANVVASDAMAVSDIALDGESILWIEMRPTEAGRYVIVRRSPEGDTHDAVPPSCNARTRVHEYGGAPFVADGQTLYVSNFDDQRLYRLDPGRDPRPITPVVPARYADGVIDRQHGRVICVREDHRGEGEPVNALVAVPADGSAAPIVLVSGADFYGSPRLSPKGDRLAWLSWHHPNMPWDGTELWCGTVQANGSIGEQERVAGGPEESIFQPQWSPDGHLTFVSDRTNWWNLYQLRAGRVDHLVDLPAEFGRPQWRFGTSTYDFASPDTLVCSYTSGGIWHLASLDLPSRTLTTIDQPYTDIAYVRAAGSRVVFRGGSPIEPHAVVALDLETEEIEVLRRTSRVPVDASYVSRPRQVEFPTGDGWTAHGFYYPPRNPNYRGPMDRLPPLLVISHGGPTSAATSTLNLAVQYWTSRGVAVLDVNYRGSTGYGRAYRALLKGAWGLADVEDCTSGARYLSEEDAVDGERLLIRGGSAGGYTTLRALTTSHAFAAGASYYGVSDLEALTLETHKFESRYLDGLVGPYPERKDLYHERSPIHRAHHIPCPVIFLQGSEDRVVPPRQAETMVEALREKGLPFVYLLFEGEQHGFRRSETITLALQAELAFYAHALGFELPEPFRWSDVRKTEGVDIEFSGLGEDGP